MRPTLRCNQEVIQGPNSADFVPIYPDPRERNSSALAVCYCIRFALPEASKVIQHERRWWIAQQ